MFRYSFGLLLLEGGVDVQGKKKKQFSSKFLLFFVVVHVWARIIEMYRFDEFWATGKKRG